MIRIYIFRMIAKVVSKKLILIYEAMGIMLADCFYYQIDYIIDDTNMPDYRTNDSELRSSAIRDS